MSARVFSCITVLLTPLLGIADPPPKTRLDAYGFPLPNGAICRLGDLRFAQPGEIIAIAISPDDKLIATAGHWFVRLSMDPNDTPATSTKNDGRIFLWDTQARRIIREIPFGAWIVRLTFSSDGRVLAAGTRSNGVMVWDVETGRSRWPKRNQSDQFAHEVTGLRFLKENRLLAVSYTKARVCLFDARNGKLQHEWRGDRPKDIARLRIDKKLKPVSVSFSPSGQKMAWLACNTDDDKGFEVVVCDTVSGRCIHRITRLRETPTSVHLLDEGNRLLIQTAGFVKRGNVVIDAKSARELFFFPFRTTISISLPVSGWSPTTRLLSVAPNLQSFYTCDGCGMIQWNSASGKQLRQWSDACASLEFFGDGKRTAVARGSRVQICDKNLKPQFAASTGVHPANQLEYSSNGQILKTGYLGHLAVWNVAKRKALKSGSFYPIPYSGRTPISTDPWGRLVVHYADKGYVVRDLANNRQMSRLVGVETDDGYGVYPSISTDGKRVLVSSDEGDTILARWFDSKTGHELGRLAIPKSKMFPNLIYRLSWYAADGSLFGFLRPNNQLALVSCQKGHILRSLGVSVAPPKLKSPKAFAFPKWYFDSSESETFVLEYQDFEDSDKSRMRQGREYAIWDKQTGALFRRFLLKLHVVRGNPVKHELYHPSPDGRLMAVRTQQDERVIFYESTTGRRRGEVCAPNAIHEFCFAPDGKTLATCCADTTILIWDINRPLNNRSALKFGANDTQQKQVWKTLADHDAEAADQAIWAMVRSPKHALPFLEKRIGPVHLPDPETLQALIATLGSRNFKHREAATNKLVGLGELAVPALQASLKSDNLEQVRRKKQILKQIEDPANPPPCLREIRVIELLERIGTHEAIRLLRRLASGTIESLVTREARLTLKRLAATR